MNNYLSGFGISFFVHSLVLSLTLFFVQTNVRPDPELLVVDFSTIGLGSETSRGAVSGSPGSAEMGSGSEKNTNSPKESANPLPVQEASLPQVVASPALPEANKPVPAVVEPSPEAITKVEPKAIAAPVQKREPKPVSKPLEKKQPTSRPQIVEKEQPRTQRARPEEKSGLSSKAQTDAQATHSSMSAAHSGQDANTGARSMDSGNGGRGQGGKQHSGLGAGSGGNSGREAGLVREYVQAHFNYILVRIRRNLDYPAQARRMGLFGVCRYSFAINMDGQISALEVVESSGHHVLDEAGKKAILRSVPFPAPPTPAQIIIPIKFSLTS